MRKISWLWFVAAFLVAWGAVCVHAAPHLSIIPLDTSVSPYATFPNQTNFPRTLAIGDTLPSITSAYCWGDIYFGILAGHSTVKSYQCVAIGDSAMISHRSGNQQTVVGASADANDTGGNFNCAFGYQAMYNNHRGRYNDAFGWGCMMNLDTGFNNDAVGLYAMKNLTNGFHNEAFGTHAMQNNTTGAHNLAMGEASLFSANTDGNVAVGASALNQCVGGHNNSVGAFAASSLITGDSNAIFGPYSCYIDTNGSRNTIIGSHAFYQVYRGSGNVIIGATAAYPDTALNNTLIIDDQKQATIAGEKIGALIYGTFNASAASQTLSLNAAVTVGQTIQPLGGYQSVDGSAGITADVVICTHVLHFKNGLLVSVQ